MKKAKDSVPAQIRKAYKTDLTDAQWAVGTHRAPAPTGQIRRLNGPPARGRPA
jgi:hypothetical protein